MYLWIKALHTLAIISWMAGLLYLPRLYVYHAMVERDSARDLTFQLMERRLLRAIMNPAMIASFIFGFWMVLLNPDLLSQGWFHVKALLVILLIGYHHMCLAHMKKLATDSSEKTHVYFRFFNEVPVIFMVAIVILVIVKPF